MTHTYMYLEMDVGMSREILPEVAQQARCLAVQCGMIRTLSSESYTMTDV